MELVSNVVGLLLTAALVGIWFAHVARVRRNLRITTLIGAVAIACVISFLFPAISFTDDLRAETSLVLKASDSDFSGQKWKPARVPQTKWNRPPAALPIGFSCVSPDASRLSITQPEAPLVRFAPRGTLQDRSPPIPSTL